MITNLAKTNPLIRPDHLIIQQMVEPESRVLDIGCGDGALLELLRDLSGVDARGVEISQSGVNKCVAKGLSVIQGDADSDLGNYPDQAFDYTILSQTIQATKQPRVVLSELLRIGKRAIVSFPNFGHIRIRSQFFLFGRMPVTKKLPHSWYDTPNIHFCTIKDFLNLCDDVDAKVEQAVSLFSGGQQLSKNVPLFLQNLIGEQAIFLLSKK